MVAPLAEIGAGAPIVAENHIVQRRPAPVATRFRPRSEYVLTVRGDSTERTGVQDPDVVGIKKTNTAIRKAKSRGKWVTWIVDST